MLEETKKNISSIGIDKKKKSIGALIVCAMAFTLFLIISKKENPVKDAPFISVVMPKRQTLPIILSIPSTFTATADVLIRNRVDGAIKKVYFKEGMPVKEGDLLIEIDDELLQTQLRQAEAALIKNIALSSQAEKEFARQTALTKRDMASKTAFDAAEATTKSLQASIASDQALIDSLKIQISYTHIKSPMNGIAGFLNVDIGNFVRQSENVPLVSIKQIDPITVIFEVPERSVSALLQSKMESIKISLTDIADKAIKANSKVIAFNNSINTKSGTLWIKVEVQNTELILRPGMSVVGKLQFGEHKNAITIPIEALQMGQDGSFIFAYDAKSKTVKKKSVVIKEAIDAVVVIESGISNEDVIVTEGQIRLSDGTKVVLHDEKKIETSPKKVLA